jgi:hypothetical protein
MSYNNLDRNILLIENASCRTSDKKKKISDASAPEGSESDFACTPLPDSLAGWHCSVENKFM